MSADDVDFAALLCSRLCHDLMSPVGAFANGLELLADERDPDLRAQYLGLLDESARASTAKLKFFRLAFGTGRATGEMLDSGEVRAVLDALLAGRKGLKIGWMVGTDMLPRTAGKLLLIIAQIAGDALLRGGRLDICAETGVDGLIEIALRAEGPRLTLDEEIRGALLGETTMLSSRNVAAAMVARLAERVLVGAEGEGVLTIGATMRALA